MQIITKDDFREDSDYLELNVKTKDKDISFDDGHYSVSNDTIFGKGITKSRIDPAIDDESFEGAISVNDVEEIRAYKFNLTGVIAIAAFVVLTAVLIVLADPIGCFSMAN
jgi:hypothetical protein